MSNTDGEASENDENGVLDKPGDRKALRILLDEVKTQSPEFATRRSMVKAAGGSMAAGALFGSGYIMRDAEAQPDGDEGSIGEQGDRVEAWISETDANSIDAAEENSIPWVFPGDDIQSKIDSVHNSSDPDESGIVRFAPPTYDSNDFELPDVPYEIQPGVTFDLRGAYLLPGTSASAIFEPRAGSTVLGEGCVIQPFGLAGTGTYLFHLDGDDGDNPTTNDPVQVYGYPEVNGNAFESVYRLTESGGGFVAGSYLTVQGNNAPQFALLESNSTGYLNNNEFRFRGSTNPDTNSVIKQTGSSDVLRANAYHFDQVQVKSGDHVVELDRGRETAITGSMADAGNVSNEKWFVGSNAAGGNNINVEYSGGHSASDLLNNSAYAVEVGGNAGDGMVPQDLSGLSGWYPGQTFLDDGTNTAGSGLLSVWTGSAWQPSDGSATYS